MNESNSIKSIDTTNLPDQTKFKLNEISKIENFFDWKIKERMLHSKKLSTYVAAFDYIDTILIALSATSRGVSVISFTTVIGGPVGITGASFTLIFSLTTGIVLKLLITTRNKKKKHNILVLAKRILNSIESLVSQALIDMEISHEDFITILNENINIKEIHVIFETKNPTRDQIRKYERNEKELDKNCTKSKLVFVRSGLMARIIKNSTGEKKRGEKQ